MKTPRKPQRPPRRTVRHVGKLRVIVIETKPIQVILVSTIGNREILETTVDELRAATKFLDEVLSLPAVTSSPLEATGPKEATVEWLADDGVSPNGEEDYDPGDYDDSELADGPPREYGDL